MCVAHTVAVRGGPRGPGVPRAATTCPSPGHRADLDMWCARRFHVCCIGCAVGWRTLCMGHWGKRCLVASRAADRGICGCFFSDRSLPDVFQKAQSAHEDGYLAVMDSPMQTAEQWRHVAGLAARMLIAARKLSSNNIERDGRIAEAKEAVNDAKAEAERKEKEAKARVFSGEASLSPIDNSRAPRSIKRKVETGTASATTP